MTVDQFKIEVLPHKHKLYRFAMRMMRDAAEAEDVRELIDDLPDQQRMIIHLRDVEGYEYEESADITGLTENTIRVNLSRARKKIREAMKNKYRYEFTKN